jgi:carbon monoxide dehydrogenase subunit G
MSTPRTDQLEQSMTRLREQIDTPLATDAAFAFVADFANSMKWDPGVATSERVDSGPVGVGARFRLGVRMRGQVKPMEYRISVFEPGRRVVLVGEGSGISAVDEIRFEPAGTGTHIDYTADIRLGGVLRLAQPFLGGAFRKIAQDALGGMQGTLDRMATDGGSRPK